MQLLQKILKLNLPKKVVKRRRSQKRKNVLKLLDKLPSLRMRTLLLKMKRSKLSQMLRTPKRRRLTRKLLIKRKRPSLNIAQRDLLQCKKNLKR